MRECEVLYAKGRIIDAAVSLLEIKKTLSEDFRGNKLMLYWVAGKSWHCTLREVFAFILSDFTNRCASTLEANGDEASKAKKYDEALEAYSTALSLGPSSPHTILIGWTKVMLVRGSVNEALDSTTQVCFF